MHQLNSRRSRLPAAALGLALLALVPAAVRAAIAGRDPVRAFVRGAGGGLLVGAGRQVAASRFDGAGLLGRRLSAAGISTMRSATMDTAAWLVPVGPLKLWVVPGSDDRLRARISLGETAALPNHVARDDARLDAGATDFASELLTGSAESWALRQLLGERIASRLEAGVLSPLLLGGVNLVTSYADRPWEREADRLSSMREPDVEGPVLH